jgi:fumarate hydratase class II
MMVTALSPVIGYDQAAAISYYAIDHDLTLKQAALAKGVRGTIRPGRRPPRADP